MEEVVPKMARQRGLDAGQSTPTSRRLNVVVWSPPLYSRVGPKWRDNYPDGPDHLVAPNRLERDYVCVCVLPGSFLGMGAFYFKIKIEETSLTQHC